MSDYSITSFVNHSGDNLRENNYLFGQSTHGWRTEGYVLKKKIAIFAPGDFVIIFKTIKKKIYDNKKIIIQFSYIFMPMIIFYFLVFFVV